MLNRAKMCLRILGAVLALMPAASAMADAALKDENLLTALPDGFKVGYQAKKGEMSISEYVPSADTSENWSKMITIQIFHNMSKYDPDVFASEMEKMWDQACKGGSAQKLKDLTENGYPLALWVFKCPLNPDTKKPENMWLKVISGADSLYTVQYAYRSEANEDSVKESMGYLRNAMVCDTRGTDHPCPSGM